MLYLMGNEPKLEVEAGRDLTGNIPNIPIHS
jgi:hypothetical protein